MNSGKKNNFCFLLILSAVITVLCFSCKKDKVDEAFPSVSVNLTVPLNLPQYSTLNSIGSYTTIQGGYRGIIIYRRAIDEFVSFDLGCPYDPTIEGAVLTVDSSGVTLSDHHCGSQFSLYDGGIVHGPSARPMKSYHTEYIADNNTVYISN